MRQHPITTARAIALGALICVTAGATAAQAQTVHVKDDTNINLAMPTQLNGTATSLFVRNIGSGGERHTYLQFDLSTVPSGVLINQAMLRFWVLAVNDAGPVDIYAIGGPWNEETLAASSAPPLGTLIGTVNVAVSDQNRFVVANITSTVQGWLNGSAPNYGIALVPNAGDPVRLTLDSKEATGTSHGPELEVAVIPTGDITAVSAGLGLAGGGTIDAVSLALDTAFTDARYALAAHGHTVNQVAGAASTGINTFTGTQTIDAGNLDLDGSSAATGNILKNGAAFLHNFGSDNTFLGVGAGNFSTTGLGRNAAIGRGSLASNTTGQQNTALGYLALGFNTTGNTNVAVGDSVLRFNTAGGANVGLGAVALQNNTTGSLNTAAGQGALRANTTASSNTAFGFNALEVSTTGHSNTGLGRSALGISNGNSNVAIGNGAGSNATTGSNNIYVGADVLGVAGESNTMYLGKFGTQTNTVIAGVRGTTVTGGEMVVVDAAGRLGTAAVATGTDTVGSAHVIDESLTASDLAPNSVTGSELAAGSVTADKVAFNYAGSTTPGGAALDVTCLGCVAASEVSFIFASLGANTFAATQTVDTGNLDLDPSTATAGNITKNGQAFVHNFGTNNTFLGINAGNLSMTGDSNTASGGSALLNNTTGGGNTATGYFALRYNTEGFGNQASGNNALRNNITGNSNAANGGNALTSNITGSYNTALGINALFSNTGGSSNVAVGNGAGLNATTGANNIYLGADVLGVAGESNTMYLGKVGTQTKTVIAGIRGTTVTGGEMVVIDVAGRLGTAAVATGADTVGSAQVIDESLTASDLAPNSVTGSELAAGSVTADKVAFNYAGSASPGGAATDVVCLGCVAASEVSFSFAALGANTFTATQTIDTGNLDLDASTATTGNVTKNGTRFLHNSGPQNTFLGEGAGTFVVTGAQNSALGNLALTSLTSGVANTAIGQAALFGTTSGSSNTATGGGALSSTSTGSGNTATGRDALLYNTTGNSNTAVGHNSLLLNTTGQGNTAAGVSALGNNLTGFGNTAMGGAALGSNTAGFENTAIGGNALAQTTGSRNVAIGQSAGANATAGSNNIYLGSLVLGAAGESNAMYLGGTQTKTFVAGIRGVTTVNADAIPVMIDSAGQLGTVSSSRRFKEDIRDMASTSQRLLQLRPVTFRYRQPFGDGSKPVQYGLIAEEVAEVFPELAVRGADGEVETVQYQTLSVLLLNELQKLQRAAHRQEDMLREQRRNVQHQQERIELLEQRLNELLGQREVPSAKAPR